MKKWFIAFFIFGGSAASFSQQQKELTADQKREIVEIAAEKLSKNYILPETANKYGDHLRSRLISGAYDHIVSPNIFADSLKADLYKVYKDKHLSVSFNPGMEQSLMNMEKSNTPPPPPNPAMEKRVNAMFRNVSIKPGNIGYVRFDGFTPVTEITKKVVDDAFGFLSNADALIIDLRYNGGGQPKMVEYISSYLFKEPTHLNSLYQRDKDTTFHYWTSTMSPNLSHVPVYVLISNNTFSAAEEFTYNLKNLKRAVIVGETTKGGAHPVRPFSTAHGVVLNIPYAKAINPVSKTNWEGVGIAPDIKAESFSALDVAYSKALNQLAENYKETPMENYFKWHANKANATLNRTAVNLRDLEGNYGPITLELKGGQLLYKRTDAATLALDPLSENLIAINGIENQMIEVLRDPSGTITGIKISYDGGKTESFKRSDKLKSF